VQHNRNRIWAEDVEIKAQQEFQRQYKGKRIGTQIRHKRRKQKGWALDDDAEERQVEYPMAMNELDKKRKQAVDDDSESKSDDEW
jgi:N-glycosylase/DNA lyase